MASPAEPEHGSPEQASETPAAWLHNPHRTAALYQPTAEGYLLAEDIASQYEYAAQHARCAACGDKLRVVAQLDRAAEGLSELVCTCQRCTQITRLLFDVSNAPYQRWLAALQGDLYSRQFDGSPRSAVTP